MTKLDTLFRVASAEFEQLKEEREKANNPECPPENIEWYKENRRQNYKPRQQVILKNWLCRRIYHPYPNNAEIQILMQGAKLERQQIVKFCTNWRKRNQDLIKNWPRDEVSQMIKWDRIVHVTAVTFLQSAEEEEEANNAQSPPESIQQYLEASNNHRVVQRKQASKF